MALDPSSPAIRCVSCNTGAAAAPSPDVWASVDILDAPAAAAAAADICNNSMSKKKPIIDKDTVNLQFAACWSSFLCSVFVVLRQHCRHKLSETKPISKLLCVAKKESSALQLYP